MLQPHFMNDVLLNIFQHLVLSIFHDYC